MARLTGSRNVLITQLVEGAEVEFPLSNPKEKIKYYLGGERTDRGDLTVLFWILDCYFV